MYDWQIKLTKITFSQSNLQWHISMKKHIFPLLSSILIKDPKPLQKRAPLFFFSTIESREWRHVSESSHQTIVIGWQSTSRWRYDRASKFLLFFLEEIFRYFYACVLNFVLWLWILSSFTQAYRYICIDEDWFGGTTTLRHHTYEISYLLYHELLFSAVNLLASLSASFNLIFEKIE